MSHHHPFRPARRSGRVEEVGHILRTNRRKSFRTVPSPLQQRRHRPYAMRANRNRFTVMNTQPDSFRVFFQDR